MYIDGAVCQLQYVLRPATHHPTPPPGRGGRSPIGRRKGNFLAGVVQL